MSDTTQSSFWFRIVNWFSASETKQLADLQSRPRELDHGATYAQPYGVRPTYNPEEAMSAYAGHGYTYAAVSRASQDLAALPLRLLQGKDRVLVEEHPVIDLLNQPSSQVDGFLFREQLCTDLILTGNCFILLLGQTDKPTSIVRLHPENVRLSTNQTGVQAYLYNSGGQIIAYPPERVVHGRLASWKSGPEELLGTGAIEPLSRELTADINSQNLVSDASAKARPDLLISPKDPADIWGPETRREIAQEYKKLSAGGGAMVLSGLAEVEPLQLSPREMEYVEARRMARESISAVTGVPPSVLGLPAANFATSRQQAKNYWTVQTKRGKRLSLLFTAIAKRWSDDLTFEHDYSGVEALQEPRTEQLNRVSMHILNGVSPRAAYKYEGLEYPDDIQEPIADYEDETAEDARSFLAKLYSSEDAELKAVGDVDPTNFPADGDDENVNLSNSQYEVFDWQYAEDLKENWPQIWAAGGNIEGNNQYRRLLPIARRRSKAPETETEEMAIRKREAFAARHFKDGDQFNDNDPPSANISSIAGIIAQIKWLMVGSLGESRMKEIINEVKKKLTKEKARTDLWKMWLKSFHQPAEKELMRATNAYLKGAAKRYQDRAEQNVKENKTKGIIDFASLMDTAGEESLVAQIIGSVWRKWYYVSGGNALKDILRLAGLPDQEVKLSDTLANEYINTLARQIVRTQESAVTKIIENGLMEGLSVASIGKNIEAATAFSAPRALRIAQTESTRAANSGTQQAYSDAAAEGIQVQKQWLSARDSLVRDSHAYLDGTVVGVNENFVSESGAEAPSPGSFGVPSEDINCRCTIIPLVD